LSTSPPTKSHKTLLVFILSCLALLAIAGVGYAIFKQAPVEVDSRLLATPDDAVAPQVYAPPQVEVEAKSEKPVLPVGLPLAKLGVICNIPHDPEKRVALTFDDGPSLAMTPEYLKILQDKGVHATFFLIGSQVQREPSLAALIAKDGNEIGNHTYSHLNLRKASLTDAASNILEGQKVIEQDTHQELSLLRPPGGELNEPIIHEIQKLGYTVVLWNIDPQDWREDATSSQIINNVMANLWPGSIILLHEGKLPTLKALPQLIDDITRRGYQIGTVSELLEKPSRPVSPPTKVTTETPPAGPTTVTPETPPAGPTKVTTETPPAGGA